MNGKIYSDKTGLRVFINSNTDYYEFPRNGRLRVVENARRAVEEVLRAEAERHRRKVPSEGCWWTRYPYTIVIREDYYPGSYFYRVDKVI